MTERYLHDLGIVAESKTKQKAVSVMYDIQPTMDHFHTDTPSVYVSEVWEKYKVQYGSEENSLNGTVFELILACVLVKWELSPFYLQAEVQYVPNSIFDLLLYSDTDGPIALSAKTSLRERYKQADLEAMALKHVHRKAESHLITLSSEEAKNQKLKIVSGEITSLDSIIVATHPEFDILISSLEERNFIEPVPLPPIRRGRKVLAN